MPLLLRGERDPPRPLQSPQSLVELPAALRSESRPLLGDLLLHEVDLRLQLAWSGHPSPPESLHGKPRSVAPRGDVRQVARRRATPREPPPLPPADRAPGPLRTNCAV